MAIQPMAADGGLSDINNLLNLVKDQKTSTSTSTNITQAGVQQQINDILGSNSGLAAVAGAQKSAGFYNSTVNTQLVNDLLSRSAAQVAARNATTTQTTAKKAPLNKLQTAISLGSLALKSKGGLKAAYDYLTAPSSADVDKALADPALASNTNDVAGLTSLDSQAASGVDLGTTASGADVGGTLSSVLADAGYTGEEAAGITQAAATSSTDVAGLTALDSEAAASDTAAAAAGTDVAGGSALADAAGTDAVIADTADAAGLATADSAAVAAEGAEAGIASGALDSSALAAAGPYGLAAAAALYVGTKYGSQIDDHIIQPVGDAIGDVVHGAEDATGWIICTELLKQGRLPRKYYAPGLRVFRSYRLDLLDGYYIWARPAVSLLQKKPYCLRSRLVSYIFNKRAEYLASVAGVTSANNSVIGQVISAAVYGFCWILGQYLKHTRRPYEGEFV